MRNEDIMATVRRCQDEGRLPDGSNTCLLCGQEGTHVAMWIPEGKELQRQFGCPKERLASGGARVMLYMLCDNCVESPTQLEDAERVLLRKMRVQ